MKRSIGMTCVCAIALTLMMIFGCDSTSTTSPPAAVDADSLALSPDTARVAVDAGFRFTVAAYDSNGAAVTANLDFESGNSGVFTVDATGRVLGVGEGVAWLLVTSGTARDSAVVVVTPAVRGWYPQTSGVAVVLHGVHFRPGGSRGWAVGDGGRILRTLDGGAEWLSQSSGASTALNAVWFTSDAEGWVVGNNGTVLHTTNSGGSWTRLLSAGASEHLNDVHFAHRDTGWVVGADGVILRTANRGVSWQRVTPTAFDLQSVSFTGGREGWAVGDNGVILGTHDGGLKWYTVQPAVTATSLRAVWRASVARANAAGAAGVVPRTVASADSASWLLTNAGAAFDLYGVCFPVPAVGFAVGSNAGGAVLRSDDHGSSWLPQLANSAFRLEDVFFVDAQRGWAVGANGTIVHTVTGGQP